jgi:hypothetical protein
MFVSYVLTVPAVAAAALAGASALNKNAILAAVLAGVASVLTALNTTLNPVGKAAAYVSSSREFRSFRFQVQKYKDLDVPHPGAPAHDIEAAKRRVRTFTDRLDGIRRGSPYLSRWTWCLQRRSARRWADREFVDGQNDPPVRMSGPPGAAI